MIEKKVILCLVLLVNKNLIWLVTSAINFAYLGFNKNIPRAGWFINNQNRFLTDYRLIWEEGVRWFSIKWGSTFWLKMMPHSSAKHEGREDGSLLGLLSMTLIKLMMNLHLNIFHKARSSTKINLEIIMSRHRIKGLVVYVLVVITIIYKKHIWMKLNVD